MQPRQKKHADDDGRVICNMNVEGMRGYDRRAHSEQPAERAFPPGEPLTRSEARLYTWYSVLAGLAVVGVFSLTLILFTLFCTQVWFR